MHAGQLKRNAVFAMAQVVLSAAALLATYWLLLRALPIAEIGLWSLIAGSTMLARLSEMGLGGGVLRFVAADLAAGEPRRAAQTVGMAAAAATLLVGALALAIAVPLQTYLLHLTPESLHAPLGVLLPAALAGVVLSTAGNVVLAAIDGCQRIDLRACLATLASFVQLAATWYVLPRWGLTGLGLVQVVQAGVSLVAGTIVLIWVMRRPLRDYLGFDRARFKEMALYGGGLQVAAMAQMLFEPLLKVLLTAYSGLALTGYFDLANRIVLQFRSLIVAAYNALVPHVAALDGAGDLASGRLRTIYREAQAILQFAALPYFACLAALLPLALTVWKGDFSQVFLWVALVQCGAWLINVLALPSYVLNVATGQLRWNIASHGLIALVIVSLGPALGAWLGGTAVLGVGAFALVAGSLLVPWAFHRRHGLALAEILPTGRASGLVLVGVAFAGSAWFAATSPPPSRPAMFAFPLAILLAAVAVNARDPARELLYSRFPLLRRLLG